MALSLRVNGHPHRVDAPDDTPLLWVLRDHLRLVGTKFGCGVSSCGACTVHVDGQPVRSCQITAGDVSDAEITTIEGISGDVATAIVKAWNDLNVVQCGYCQSGQIMSAIALLNETPTPDREDIDAAMDGNVCRCATYHRIRDAINLAANTLKAG